MTLGDLGVLYGIAGTACAVAVYRRHRDQRSALASAAVTVVLWPLWAPIALTAPRSGTQRAPALTNASRRIESALNEGALAANGSPLSALIKPDAVERILADVGRAEARQLELETLLAQGSFDRDDAAERLATIEREGGSSRSLATARLHFENISRLHRLLERDRLALEQLADLVEALRTQLVLARYAGSSLEGVGGIVSEVWDRVESLGAAMDEVTPREDSVEKP